MGLTTGILNIVSFLSLTNCTIELFKFLRWDERYFDKLSFKIIEGTRDSVLVDVFCDLGLLLIFLCQHRLMSHMKHWSRVEVSPIFGHLYVITSSLTLLMLMTYWSPIPSVTVWSWNISSYPLLILFFRLVYYFAWGILLLENLVYITQIFAPQINKVFYRNGNFQRSVSSGLIHLREVFPHPGLLCFTIILWVTPTLTLDRWLLATVLSWYIYVPRRVTKKDYKYFCECYSHVKYYETHVSY